MWYIVSLKLKLLTNRLLQRQGGCNYLYLASGSRNQLVRGCAPAQTPARCTSCVIVAGSSSSSSSGSGPMLVICIFITTTLQWYITCCWGSRHVRNVLSNFYFLQDLRQSKRIILSANSDWWLTKSKEACLRAWAAQTELLLSISSFRFHVTAPSKNQ